MEWQRWVAIAVVVVAACGPNSGVENTSPVSDPIRQGAPRNSDTPTPSPLPAAPRDRAVLASRGLRDDQAGVVWGWGRGGHNLRRVGESTRENPERVGKLARIVAVAAGLEHGLALDADGIVWTWSESAPATPGATPARPERVVPGLRRITAIAAGDKHSLALRADGTVWAWGDNTHGQLGDGTQVSSQSPLPVTGLQSVTAIAAGDYHSLALLADGTVYGWGRGLLGQIGTGDHRIHPTAQLISELRDVTAIAAGGAHSLAVTADGDVWTWGYPLAGAGDEVYRVRLTPVRVEGVGEAIAVAAGWGHSLVLTRAGTVWAWGANSLGQLGDGTAAAPMLNPDKDLEPRPRGEPQPVPGLDGIIAIAAGQDHSLALRADGAVWSWGSNILGELGSGRKEAPVYRASSHPVPALYGVSAISARGTHSLAVQTERPSKLPTPGFAAGSRPTSPQPGARNERPPNAP